MGERVLFEQVSLREPPKALVRGFAAGAEVPREAFAVVLDRDSGKTYEAVISLSEGSLKSSIPIRWFWTGALAYFITCLQCAFQVTLTFQQVIHFTDWVVGHAHMVMFGVFGFWLLGITTYLWPRLTGNAWYSLRLNLWHYWLSVVGLSVMFLDLVIAGLIQGFSWRSLAPWEESLVISSPFWSIRLWSGVLIIIGQLCFAWNMYKTATMPKGDAGAAPVPEPQPAV